MDFSLDRSRILAQAAGLLDIPAEVKIITIAGTNGKGTSCGFLAQVLNKYNKKVGLFTSPHLVKINERFNISGELVTDCDLISAFSYIEKIRLTLQAKLTYFEFCTLAALYLFKNKACDIWVLEVGLGGRLDATNIINADVAVITTVDLDHTAILGDNLADIVRQKTGIFRARQQIFCGDNKLCDLVGKYAQALTKHYYCEGVAYLIESRHDFWNLEILPFSSGDSAVNLSYVKHIKYNNLPIGNIPIKNMALIIYILHIIFPEIIQSIDFVANLKSLIKNYYILGRLSIIKSAQASLPADILCDGAHNFQASNYLSSKLEDYYLNKYFINTRASDLGDIHLIFSAFADKDIRQILSPIVKVLDNIKVVHPNINIIWYLLQMDHPRAASVNNIKKILLDLSPGTTNIILFNILNNTDALEDALNKSIRASFSSLYVSLQRNVKHNDFILAFGSLFLIGGLLAYFGIF